MLRYLFGNELARYPALRDSMFRDRADQFSKRLNWDVVIDETGHERDEYDLLNPLYVIWEQGDGIHGGSLRLMPTLGPTMIADHFPHLCDGVTIKSPLIWECTRFCLAPGAERRVSAALVLGAGEVMDNYHLSHFIGVFDPRMERIYRFLGVEPDVIGSAGQDRDRISVGLWEMKRAAWPKILSRVGISRQTSRNWFHGLQPAKRRAKANTRNIDASHCCIE